MQRVAHRPRSSGSAATLVVLLASLNACGPCDPVNAPPPNEITFVLDSGGPPADKNVLVLVGDSITQGTVGYRWADDVTASLGDDWFVINAGINGQIAWEVAERTDQVIACDPDVVVVLIGTNDAMAEYDPAFGQQAVDDRGLPKLPDEDFYREQLTRIKDDLGERTDARVALLSIPTIGEDPDADVWALSERYAAVAREVALEGDVVYAPLFENMAAALQDLPARETPSTDDWLSLMGEGIFLRQLGISWHDIGEGRGFYLHTDHLHLDEDGGALVTELVLDIIDN